MAHTTDDAAELERRIQSRIEISRRYGYADDAVPRVTIVHRQRGAHVTMMWPSGLLDAMVYVNADERAMLTEQEMSQAAHGTLSLGAAV